MGGWNTEGSHECVSRISDVSSNLLPIVNCRHGVSSFFECAALLISKKADWGSSEDVVALPIHCIALHCIQYQSSSHWAINVNPPDGKKRSWNELELRRS